MKRTFADIKKIAALVVAVSIVAASFFSCSAETADKSETESQTVITGENSMDNVKAGALVLASGGKSEYTVICPRVCSSEMSNAIRDFIAEFEKKSGVHLALYPESCKETAKEIIVGPAVGRKQAARALASTSYTGCAVTLEAEKIIVSAFSTSGVETALSALLDATEQNSGDYLIDSSFVFTADEAPSLSSVPRYDAENARFEGIYYCGENNYELLYSSSERASYDAYLMSLSDGGFVKRAENRIGENLFVTFEKEGVAVRVSFSQALSKCRIVMGTDDNMPDFAEYRARVKPSVTQIGREGASNTAPGMSYIIQVSDGSYIIIDGGPANKNDEDALLSFLCVNAPDGEKPVVALWIITHAHSDHMALVNSFLSRYHDKIEVKAAAFNFPDYEAVKDSLDVKGNEAAYTPMIELFKNNIRTYYKDAKLCVVHSGDRLGIADAEINILFTHEDYYPAKFTYVNHTSCAFTVKLGGKTMLFLGDCEKQLCQQMADVYGGALKCDILQLTHHGYNGACLDLYKLADPDICFWPCSETAFESDPRCLGTKEGYEFNKWLRDDSLRERTHYASSETVTIPLAQ